MNALPTAIKKQLQELRTKYPEIPVPVVDIARDLGLRIFATYDFKSAESGSLRRENSQYIIYINPTETPERQRFTIAHELGHFLMHKDVLSHEGDEFVDSLKQAVISLNRSNDVKESTERKREIEANQFAAALLMPEKEFKKIFLESNDLEKIASLFRVSQSAATVRAKELLGLFII